MKVIGLQIENLRKINAVDMQFTDKGLIQIRGKNEQGKSTILDSIEILLRGKKFTPKDVITHGEKKARIISQIGDYKIERHIDQKGDHKIKVSGADGKQVTTSPQSFLDTLINELTFDPRPFVDKTSDQKLKFMMDLLAIDFSSIDADLKEKETERTLVGREVKTFGELPILAKVESVDVSELMLEKEKADKTNNDIERGNEAVTRIDGETKAIESDIQKLKDQLALKEMELIKKTNEMDVVKDALAGLGHPIDTSEINQKINNASEINRQALAYEANQKKKSEKADKESQYEELNESIKSLRSKKEEMLKAAPMPVEGLEIREDGVYYDGIHCDNWSDSQSIKISFQLCLAMQPELKAVFIDRGESYDKDQLAMLDKWANENDIQAFITIVDSGNVGDVYQAIYIEDGSIVS